MSNNTLKNKFLYFLLCVILFPLTDLKAEEIKVYWYVSKPFVFKDKNEMKGIECDLLSSFKQYLKETENKEIQITYVEARDFGDVMHKIEKSTQANEVGISAISITESRKKRFLFSKPYFSDVSVIVNHKQIPVINQFDSFLKTFDNLQAITIAGTTYEEDLKELQIKNQLKFTFKYIPSSKNIIDAINENKNTFGYIDLPIYLMRLNKTNLENVVRQNLFVKKREGHAIIFPKTSHLKEEFDSFLNSEYHLKNFPKIIDQYIDYELFEFIETISKNDNGIEFLLMKEKELQQAEIETLRKIQQAEDKANKLLKATAVGLLVLIIVAVLIIRKIYQDKQQLKNLTKIVQDQNNDIKQKNHNLQSLNDERNNLLALISHDLRSPLNNIKGLIQVIEQNEKKLSNQSVQSIYLISESVQHLLKLTSSILEIESAENKLTENLDDFSNINELVAQLLSGYKHSINKKNIELQFHPISPSVNFQTNELLLIQIIDNLISNAIKYCYPNKRIEIVIKKEKNELWLTVKDEGPGIKPDELKLLFKKYQKLSSKPTGDESSTGLGLYIVQKYAEKINAQIICDSVYGQGAVFILKIKGVFH